MEWRLHWPRQADLGPSGIPMTLDLGTRLGSLEITALLGKGGMGEVYRARDTKLRRDVAVKTLDWGFPVRCLPVVNELQAEGVRLIWFDGDRTRARIVFQKRGGLALSDFDAQVADIAAAGYPKSLDCVVVMALSAQGVFKQPKAVERTVFP